LQTSDRLDLIMRITDYMRREYTWDRTGFILANYGLAMSEDDPLEHDIAAATDDQLVDMAQLFGLDLPVAIARLLGLDKPVAVEWPLSASTDGRSSTGNPLFVFGSHLSEHKAFVGEVGRELAKFGIHLFVAHDTIEHDKLWQDEIEAGLDRADAAVVFIHPGLKNSAWCDQEIGWLQGRKVPVMALRFSGETPYGFFAKY
jgi:TIR domain